MRVHETGSSPVLALRSERARFVPPLVAAISVPLSFITAVTLSDAVFDDPSTLSIPAVEGWTDVVAFLISVGIVVTAPLFLNQAISSILTKRWSEETTHAAAVPITTAAIVGATFIDHVLTGQTPLWSAILATVLLSMPAFAARRLVELVIIVAMVLAISWGYDFVSANILGLF